MRIALLVAVAAAAIACSSGSGGAANDASGGSGGPDTAGNSAAKDSTGTGPATDSGTEDTSAAVDSGGGNGGGGGGFECPNAEGAEAMANAKATYADGETGTCMKASCDKEMTAAYGAKWSSGDFTGGVCGPPTFYCACQCGSKDKECLTKCYTEHPDKNDAMACAGPASDVATCQGKSCPSK